MKKVMKVFSELDVKYPEKLLEVHKDLPYLPERMKIESQKACY